MDLNKKAQTEIQVTEVVSHTLKGHLGPVDLLSPVITASRYLKILQDTNERLLFQQRKIMTCLVHKASTTIMLKS